MALVLKDRVKETCTSPGTGTVTLLGASTGYSSFSTIGNANTTYYCIADQSGNNWEVGIGTYTSSGTTLSRNTVLSNSAGNTSLINFSSGTQDVFVTYPSGRSVYADGTTLTATNSSVLPVASGGTGQSSYTDGQLLIGNSTGNTLTKATLTAGAGITITNGTGAITIAAGGGSAFPSGTVMLFVQTTAPTGWTKSTTHDNKALRVVSGTASTGGSVAFTTAFAASLSAGSTTLSTAQMPSHSHTVASNGTDGGPTAGANNNNSTGADRTYNTGTAGSSNSHNHTLPSFAVSYVDVIIATAN